MPCNCHARHIWKQLCEYTCFYIMPHSVYTTIDIIPTLRRMFPISYLDLRAKNTLRADQPVAMDILGKHDKPVIIYYTFKAHRPRSDVIRVRNLYRFGEQVNLLSPGPSKMFTSKSLRFTHRPATWASAIYEYIYMRRRIREKNLSWNWQNSVLFQATVCCYKHNLYKSVFKAFHSERYVFAIYSIAASAANNKLYLQLKNSKSNIYIFTRIQK